MKEDGNVQQRAAPADRVDNKVIAELEEMREVSGA